MEDIKLIERPTYSIGNGAIISNTQNLSAINSDVFIVPVSLI